MRITKQYTTRESKSLDKYFQEIGKVELLTAEQEVKLAKKIKKGNEQALNKLVNSNLRFVVSVAKQYQNQGLSLGDLINEGNLGLIKAAHKFDETRGFKFISYAVWWIRQSILQAIAEHSRIVRLSLNRVGTLSKISKAFSALEQDYEREPSASEIADQLDMNLTEVRDVIKLAGRQISIDKPIKDDESNNLLNVLPDNQMPRPDEDLLKESLSSDMHNVLSQLTEKESLVLKLYYGIDTPRSLTLEEIGEKFNLTRERVRQIKEKALRRLRHESRSKHLKSYLG